MKLIFKEDTLIGSLSKFNAVNQLSKTLIISKNDISIAMLGFFMSIAVQYRIRYKYLIEFAYDADTDSFFIAKKTPAKGEENNINHYWAAPERMPSQFFDVTYTEGMSDLEIQEALDLKELQKTWVVFPLPDWWKIVPSSIQTEFLQLFNAELVE